ncbi:MAG: helix-turn-helix domain-containing protein [Gaiellaceae bacterium]
MSIEMPPKRKYELKKRAERLEETRRRITEATVELHRTVGPAATQISEIARRAGVQRMTVYNHFPDEVSLLAACSVHWRALHPHPDPAAWRTIEDPGERLRLGLRELYAWYRETEPMTANILRDAAIVPALGVLVERGLGGYLDNARRALTDPIRVQGHRRARVDAAARAAVDFHFWRALAVLGDGDAAELAAGMVELAGTPSARREC